MTKFSFSKPLWGLGTTLAAAIIAVSLTTPNVYAQGKGDSGGGRGSSGPSASPGGGGKGGGSITGDRGGRSMAPSDRSGNSVSRSDRGRSFSDQSSSRSDRDGRDNRQFSGRRDGDRRRHSRRDRGGVAFGYSDYGYSYGYTSDDCAWLYRRAVNSGSRYWWRRYRACVN